MIWLKLYYMFKHEQVYAWTQISNMALDKHDIQIIFSFREMDTLSREVTPDMEIFASFHTGG